MTWQQTFADYGLTVATRGELLSAGATGRALTGAVKAGYLVRVRRDHYALPGTAQQILQGIRVGGRLTCVSALQLAGVFAFDATFPHIHLPRTASRSRSPRNGLVPLTEFNRDGAELHWWPLFGCHEGSEFAVGIADALAHAVRCQNSWHAIASLDNALHLGKIDETDVAEIFRHLPGRFLPLRAEIDGRSEAGQETVLRLIMQAAGLHCELQVTVPGVGRVDMIVEGILVLEADSRLAHDGWELHVRDRDRDIDLARQGYMSLRPVYNRTMHYPNDVRDAALNLLAAWNHNRVHIS
jgi:hypothetical protein